MTRDAADPIAGSAATQPGRGARFILRDATDAAHQRVDAAFSRLDPTTRDGYAAFLTAQARAHLPVEAALDAAGAQGVIPDWPRRRRAEALRTDMAALGLTPEFGPSPPPFDTPAAVTGAAYVLEGSRLGGKLLARSAPPGAPTRFLTQGEPEAWREFVRFLDESLVARSAIEEAVAAALSVFEAFEESAANALETRPF